MDSAETKFAPAERADAEAISSDSQRLAAGLVHHMTGAIPCAVMILNPQRQVVYTNEYLMNLLGAASDDEVLGKRPGELLGCIHASEMREGCGTTEFCSECGAVNAILKSQNEGIAAEEECRVLTTTGDAYEFRVWATPYEFGGKEFTVFSLVDIRDEKRRSALERTFFHDVNNSLNAIVGYSHLLSDAPPESDALKYIKTLCLASDRLTEEIASHRRLLEAETGRLTPTLSTIDSSSLLRETAELYSNDPQWTGRQISMSGNAESCGFTSERALLVRVLGNMLRNALEATSADEMVTLSCSRGESSLVFSVHNPGFIPRRVQLQIFQRSFSTKGTGRGTGTYSMKLFGERYLKGKVWFSTSEDEGTTFYVSIPIVFPDTDS